MYFCVPFGTFGYCSVLLGIIEYFWVFFSSFEFFLGTVGYFMVLFGSGYGWVLLGTFAYF